MMESFINSPQWYNLALTLIHFLWQGGLIALVLKLLLSLTPYSKSQLRYTWATLAMLACLTTPIITFIVIYQPSYQPSNYFAGDIAAIISTQNLADADTFIWYQDIVETLPYISLLWLATVALLASKLLVELYNVNRLPNIASIAPPDELNQRFATLAAQVGLTKTPRLLISLKAEIPMALGWLKPVILIPAAMLSGLTPGQLDMLILHELAHVRRHDYIVNFIQTWVETLLFFHPGVRWISKQMRNEREYCSDDIAVSISGTPVDYAKTLADTATLCSKHRHNAIPAMAMAASGGDLKQRVVRLVDQHHCSSHDDSGKFLATVLIVFSVVAVLVKPYLNENIIDLSSGRISLFQTANEFIHKKPVNTSSLSATSIARLLLQKDQAIVDQDVEQTIQITENTSQGDQADKDSSQLLTEHTVPKDATQVANSNVTNEPQVTSRTISDKPKTGQIKHHATTDSRTEQLLNNQPKKYSSQLAFDRTDSSKQHSNLSNPYAKQVADLSSEPLYQADNESMVSAAKPSKKISVKPVIKKPLFTITTEKPASPKPKQQVVKKAARILASPDPRYPSTAKRRGLELDVKVNFIIDAQGKVQDIEFEEKNKVSYFRSAIRTAMAKWRFLPAKINGKPVESKMSKIFSFSLMK